MERDQFLYTEGDIFVFGSNLNGTHGKGAAWTAKRYYGAKQGLGVGFSGRLYAIPTKDKRLKVLPLSKIKDYVDAFIEFAINRPDLKFFITPIGTGLAGYSDEDIAPMFLSCLILPNCKMHPRWVRLLNGSK